MLVEPSILLVCTSGRLQTRLAKQIHDGFNDRKIFIKEACCVEKALRIVDNHKPDLIIAEVELADSQNSNVEISGHKLGYALKAKNLNIPIILLGNHECPVQAVREAMLQEVISSYRLIANMTPLLWRQLIFYSLNLSDDRPLFIGSSPAVLALKEELNKHIMKGDMSVLILGESGTGKTILAKYIHQHSQRADKAFIPVNCAAIPPELIESELFGHKKGSYTGADNDRKGLFQAADKGTLFLDEIGDMPLLLQSRLLRAVEEGLVRPVGGDTEVKIDVRVISATNQDVKSLVKNGCFRQDLYFRLEQEVIELPPLSQRKEDIVELAEAIILKACRKDGVVSHPVTLSKNVIQQMKKYPWPGNIRELTNLLERAVRRTSPESPSIESLSLPDIICSSDKAKLYRQLKDEGMNNKGIAEKLGVSERHLYRLVSSGELGA